MSGNEPDVQRKRRVIICTYEGLRKAERLYPEDADVLFALKHHIASVKPFESSGMQERKTD